MARKRFAARNERQHNVEVEPETDHDIEAEINALRLNCISQILSARPSKLRFMKSSSSRRRSRSRGSADAALWLVAREVAHEQPRCRLGSFRPSHRNAWRL